MICNIYTSCSFTYGIYELQTLIQHLFKSPFYQESRVAEVEIYFLGGTWSSVKLHPRVFIWETWRNDAWKTNPASFFKWSIFRRPSVQGVVYLHDSERIVFISWWRSDRKNSSSKYSVVGGFVVSYPTIMTEWKFPPAIKMSWFLYFFPRRKYSEVWYSWQLSHFWFLLLSPTHRIHVWYIHLHSVEFDGKCRWIYHTWIIWANHFNADHTAHLDGLASRNPSSARYPWVSVHHRRCPVHCVSRSRVMCRFVVDVCGMLVLFNNLFLVLKVIKFLTEHNQRIDLYYIYMLCGSTLFF